MLGLAIELAPSKPGLGAGGARLWIDPNALHWGEVYDDAAVTRRIAGYGVPPAPHRNDQLILARKVHRSSNICDAHAAGDQSRTPVDHRVEDGAGCVVAVVFREIGRASCRERV